MNQPNHRALAFLRQGTEILITRRTVEGNRQPWSTVAAIVDGPDDNPFTRAIEAVQDATGLTRDDITLAAAGTDPQNLIETTVGGTTYGLSAFLFDINQPNYTPVEQRDIETRWVSLHDLDDLETVAGLAEALEACMEAERGKRLQSDYSPPTASPDEDVVVPD